MLLAHSNALQEPTHHLSLRCGLTPRELAAESGSLEAQLAPYVEEPAAGRDGVVAPLPLPWRQVLQRSGDIANHLRACAVKQRTIW